jgi:hypothetical protein
MTSWANNLPAKAAAIASKVVSFSASFSLSRNASQHGPFRPAVGALIPANVDSSDPEHSEHSSRGGLSQYNRGAIPEESDTDTPQSVIVVSYSVLLVDDSPTILKTMSRTLQRAKYVVETANNGAMALEMMKKTHYDAVLMDIQM